MHEEMEKLHGILLWFVVDRYIQYVWGQDVDRFLKISLRLLNPLSTGRTLRRQFSCFFPLNFGRWTLTMNIAPTTMS